MSGTFKLSAQGGWEGRLLTLTIDRKLRFLPNDDRKSENGPDFIAMLGWSKVGAAWRARSRGEPPRDYLRIQFHDPTWASPLRAMLFLSQDGLTAQLVWESLWASNPGGGD